MIRFVAFLLIVAFAIAAVVASEHRPPNADLPMVRADYPICVTVRPGPIRPPTRPVLNPRLSEIA